MPDASWNALTDPYVLLVILLSLVVNTIPSLTVRLYCTIVGKNTVQQVGAGMGRGLRPAGVGGRGTAGAGKSEGPQGSHCLGRSSGMSSLSWWWSPMTLVSKPGSKTLSPDRFMARQEALRQETCSSSWRGST